MRYLITGFICLLMSFAASSTALSQQAKAPQAAPVLVPLVVHNDSKAKIDFGFYDLPENQMSVMLNPGEKSGDAKAMTSDMLLVVPAGAASQPHTAVDNKSGFTWKFNISKDSKMVFVKISDKTPASGKAPFNVEISTK